MERQITFNAGCAIYAALAIACAIVSGFIVTQVVGEVNRKLPDDHQFSYWWWNAVKYRRLRSEYRRLYPNGRAYKAAVAFEIACLCLWLLAVIAAGFFY